MEAKKKILDKQQIKNIINRIAIQIIENNYDEKKIFLIGIEGQGLVISKLLKTEIEKNTKSIECIVKCLKINKINPVFDEIKLECPLEEIKNQTVIISDDVLKSGRTLAFTLSYIMQASVKKIETAILVNRIYTSYPISATYSGLELSTTFENHISVKIIDNEMSAYLN